MRTSSPIPIHMSNILLPYAFEKASLYFSFLASLIDKIASGILEATAAIKNVMKNKFIFNCFERCSLLTTSSLHAIEIMISDIINIKIAFQVFSLDLFKIKLATFIFSIFFIIE